MLSCDWTSKEAFPSGIGFVTDMKVENGLPVWTILTKIGEDVMVRNDFSDLAKDVKCNVGLLSYLSQDDKTVECIGTLAQRYADAKDNADVLPEGVFPLKSDCPIPEAIVPQSVRPRRSSNSDFRFGPFVNGDDLDFRTEDMHSKPKGARKKSDESSDDEPKVKRGPGRPRRSSAMNRLMMSPSPNVAQVVLRRLKPMQLLLIL